MFCEMDRPISDSVRQIGLDRWLLGSAMVCEQGLTPHERALVSWHDENGNCYSVCHATEADGRLRTRGKIPGDALPEDLLLHQAGTASAVWKLGGTVCKVKSWIPGLQLEHETITFINEHFPSIPTAKVLFAWIDEPLNRTFTILETVKGNRLDRAWPSLSDGQRQSIAAQIAAFCATLATQTSTKYETLSRYGSAELFLIPREPKDHPSWKPVIWDPQGLDKATEYFFPLKVAHSFVLYHADLGPTNIFINRDGEVQAVIDWESAAFYPKFYVALKPLISYGFVLEDFPEELRAWSELLASELQKMGFESDKEAYKAWKLQRS
ncbi:kinase-like domain-containing protein [Phyllosticta paracitricarpa]|uniref:Kinase-like domain-containing protein n=1 Tax=Phyllosticta paracitricarpa TaxID=2016321 RepID=A0ABR1MX51_9PEZI